MKSQHGIPATFHARLWPLFVHITKLIFEAQLFGEVAAAMKHSKALADRDNASNLYHLTSIIRTESIIYSKATTAQAS